MTADGPQLQGCGVGRGVLCAERVAEDRLPTALHSGLRIPVHVKSVRHRGRLIYLAAESSLSDTEVG